MGQGSTVLAGRIAGVAAILAAGALLLGAPAPAAAKKCVRPNGGGGCFATVQEAIDAASDGETILVRPGVYRGSVAVNKRVLLLGGGKVPGQVVLNGRHLLTTVTVDAGGAGSTIRNLTVWNAGGDLVAIDAGATGVTLSRVILRQAVGDCVSSLGAGTKVLGSSVRNCGSIGVRASGDGFVMRASSVLVTSSNCVDVGGSGAQIVGSRLQNCGDYGLSLSAPGGVSAFVSGNRVQGVRSTGIYVDSPNATVQGNLVDGALDSGFDIQSAQPLVSRNIARSTGGNGFLVACSAGCTGGRVVRNRAELSGDDGFDLRFSAAVLVRDNVATGTGNNGFWLANPGPYEVRGNRAQSASSSCFGLDDTVTSALLVGNGADSCRDDGYLVASDGTTLRGNRARNALFGFHVVVGAAAAVLEDNTATMNNRAFCDDTLLVDLTGKGNNFDASICSY